MPVWVELTAPAWPRTTKASTPSLKKPGAASFWPASCGLVSLSQNSISAACSASKRRSDPRAGEGSEGVAGVSAGRAVAAPSAPRLNDGRGASTSHDQVLRAHSCGRTCRLAALRAPVGDGDPHQDVVGIGLGVVDRHVEVASVIENAGVLDLVFRLMGVALGVLLHQLVVGEGGVRILVEHPHQGVAGRAVEIPPQLLDVLAVVAFGVGQPEHPLLQDRVLAVPQRQPEAPGLLLVAEAGDGVLAPAIGAPAGVIVGKVRPGVAVGAVVLPHGAPLPFGHIRPPPPPSRRVRVSQPLALDRFQRRGWAYGRPCRPCL